MTTATAQTSTTQARPDCLVVATPSADLVARTLGRWGCPSGARSDDRLGLTLLDLNDPQAAASNARDELREVLDPAGCRAVEEAVDLDIILRGLRHRFAQDHAGWVPTMGKNRLVELVTPAQTIQFGGQDAEESEPLPKRMDVGNCGRGITVGIIDTPIARHPYIDTRFDPRGDFQRHTPSGHGWHGTFVAGVVSRMAPQAAILGRPAGPTHGELESWDVACSLAALAGEGLPLINISLTCHTEDNQPPLIFQAARAALGSETLVVAAAGNNAQSVDGRPNVARPSWPAALDGVVAVGSIHDAQAREASGYSPVMPWVDVYAPGDDVVSAWKVTPEGHTFAKSSGTSFAAAAVTGLVAATMGHDSAATALERLVDRGSTSGLPVVAL